MTHPVAAICGHNPVLPSDRVGCGAEIQTCAEVFRCVDCGVAFHRDCLRKHCEDDVAKARIEERDACADVVAKESRKQQARARGFAEKCASSREYQHAGDVLASVRDAIRARR